MPDKLPMTISPNDIAAHATEAANRVFDQRTPITHEGLVMDGSYDPDENTIDFKIGASEASAQLPGEQVSIEGGVPLIGTYGIFYAPRGGERVVCIPSIGGQNAFLHPGHGGGIGKADTLGAAAGIKPGEIWIVHYNGQGVIDQTIKLTNDGSPGDGLGGIVVSSGSRTTVTTTGGVAFKLDDATKLATLVDGSGFGITIDFGNKVIMQGASGDGPPQQLMTMTDVANAFTAYTAMLNTAFTLAFSKLATGSGAIKPVLVPITLTSSSEVEAHD